MDNENWKQFKGTEIGSLLSSIYGKQNQIKTINYPILKGKTKEFEPSRKFNSSGAPLHEVKPKKQLHDLVIPLPRKKTHHLPVLAPVDLIPKRKSGNVIHEEINQIQFQQQHYRPAHSHAISSEAEKERLNQIFTHKGGKGLPEDFILPVSKAPFEIEQQNKQMMINNNNSSHFRRKNNQYSDHSPNSNNGFTSSRVAAPLTADEELCIQITQEINERMNHLEEMKANDIISRYEEAAIENEIKQRARELKSLHLKSSHNNKYKNNNI